MQPARTVKRVSAVKTVRAAAFLVTIPIIGLHYIACGGFKHGYTGYTAGQSHWIAGYPSFLLSQEPKMLRTEVSAYAGTTEI